MGVAKVLHRYCIAVAQVLHRCLIDVALWFFILCIYFYIVAIISQVNW